MQSRFGRIQLDRIAAEWGDGHPINPRLLASEVAAVLRTLAPLDHPIQETYATAILSAITPGSSVITYGSLAAYFDSASLGTPDATIITNKGQIPANTVLIWRQWINTVTNEAAERAMLVAGLALPANDSSSTAMVIGGPPRAPPHLATISIG